MFKKIAGVVVAVAPMSAFAEVPATVTTAIGDAVTDVGTIGAAILGVVIGIVVFNWLRRVIK